MLLATVLMATALTAGAPEVPPGTPIVAIRIVRHDIFDTDDPETSSWPYRWANALHVLTREQFIRSMLLFRVGDKLDPALLEESARLLRFTEFLSPVNITTHPAPGGAEVVVATRRRLLRLRRLHLLGLHRPTRPSVDLAVPRSPRPLRRPSPRLLPRPMMAGRMAPLVGFPSRLLRLPSTTSVLSTKRVAVAVAVAVVVRRPPTISATAGRPRCLATASWSTHQPCTPQWCW